MANANPIIKPEPGVLRRTLYHLGGMTGYFRWERAHLLVDKVAGDSSFRDSTVLLEKAASLLERAMREQRSNRFVGPDSQEGYVRKEKQAAELAGIYSTLVHIYEEEGFKGLSVVSIYREALAHKARLDALRHLVGREGNEQRISEVRSTMLERLRSASSLCDRFIALRSAGEGKNLFEEANWLTQKSKTDLTLAQELSRLGVEFSKEADTLGKTALQNLEKARLNTEKCLEAPVNSDSAPQRKLYKFLSEIHGLKAMALTTLGEPGADEEKRKSDYFLEKSK